MWPHHKNHHWTSHEVLKTTLCYLTLPNAMGPHVRYSTGEYEGESGYYDVACAQALPANIPVVSDPAKMHRQFQRALQLLDLQPSLHPSQKHDTNTSRSKKEKVGVESGTNDLTDKKKRCKFITRSPLSQLTDVSYDGRSMAPTAVACQEYFL
jgi:hypothetical protein